jgi:hypothetical protein
VLYSPVEIFPVFQYNMGILELGGIYVRNQTDQGCVKE